MFEEQEKVSIGDKANTPFVLRGRFNAFGSIFSCFCVRLRMLCAARKGRRSA